jgi:hypothetical protein
LRSGRLAPAEKHFNQLGMLAFVGDYVYGRLVTCDCFLVQVNQGMDWDASTDILLPAYQGLADVSRPPYPVVVFKMLIITYLHSFSKRQVEDTDFDLALKEYVGLAVDARAPDHSTLCEFNQGRRVRRWLPVRPAPCGINTVRW